MTPLSHRTKSAAPRADVAGPAAAGAVPVPGHMPPSAAAGEQDPALSVQAPTPRCCATATSPRCRRTNAPRRPRCSPRSPPPHHPPRARGTARPVTATSTAAAASGRCCAAGGEPGRCCTRRGAPRPRRLVLLVDVSGSMSPYADALLRLAHALVRHRPRWTEVYRARHPAHATHPGAAASVTSETALREAGQAIPDWRGGTRLADASPRSSAGTVTGASPAAPRSWCFSDGWERGDPARLGAQRRPPAPARRAGSSGSARTPGVPASRRRRAAWPRCSRTWTRSWPGTRWRRYDAVA